MALEIEGNEKVNNRQLIHKIDTRLMPYLCLLYLLSFLDRVNLGNIRLYGLEASLGLTGTDYQWALSMFFIGYVLFEVPSNLMLTKVRPSVWMSRIMITWGVITMSMSTVKNATGLILARFFLGIAEAGLVPGLVFFMTKWYTQREQATRIGFFFTATSVAGAFSGLICYGILRIDGAGGLQGWQWVFLVEGIPTVIVGILTFFLLADSPDSVSWLTDAEKEELSFKINKNIKTTGFDKSQFVGVLKNYKVYLHMLFYFCYCVPFYSLALLMPSIIKGLGFTSLNAMLMTVPPYAITFFFTMAVAMNSDRKLDRSSHVVFSACTSLLGFALLLVLPPSFLVLRYLSVCLGIMGATACIAPALAWSNHNFPGSTASATAGGMIIASGNFGGFLAGQLYRATEAPNYYTSHIINASCLVATITTSLLLRYIYSKANQRLQSNNSTKSDMHQTTEFRFVL